MNSIPKDIICGVCTNILRDPYTLPCGHTFCLRPCLLHHARAVDARCIYCHIEVSANELSPNYSLAGKVHLFMTEQQEAHDTSADPTKQVVHRRTKKCGACRSPTEELNFCRHCQQMICPKCSDRHIDNYNFMLRVKVNSLTATKEKLLKMKKSFQENVQKTSSKHCTIVKDLDDVVTELQAATSESLQSALSTLEVTDMEGYEVLSDIGKKLAALSSELGTVQEIAASVSTLHILSHLLEKQRTVQKFYEESLTLEKMIQGIKRLPITRMQLSKQVNTIGLKFEGFDLIICDGPMPPERTLAINQSRRAKRGESLKASKSPSQDDCQSVTSKVKLYVGGLRMTHTADQIREYFEHYGTLDDCYLALDFKTKESRGYAFVTFRDPSAVDRVLKECPHFIDSGPVHVRRFNCQKTSQARLNPIKEGEKSQVKVSNKCRIFVAGLDFDATQDAVLKYFSQFGCVTKVDIVLDRASGKSRGIAFVNFDSPETAAKVLAIGHEMNGRSLFVSSAFDKANEKQTGKASQPQATAKVKRSSPKKKNSKAKPSPAKGDSKSSGKALEDETETSDPLLPLFL